MLGRTATTNRGPIHACTGVDWRKKVGDYIALPSESLSSMTLATMALFNHSGATTLADYTLDQAAESRLFFDMLARPAQLQSPFRALLCVGLALLTPCFCKRNIVNTPHTPPHQDAC